MLTRCLATIYFVFLLSRYLLLFSFFATKRVILAVFYVQEAISILILSINFGHLGVRLEQSLALNKQIEGFLLFEIDSVSEEMDKLVYFVFFGHEVLILVKGTKSRLVMLFTDDGDLIRVLIKHFVALFFSFIFGAAILKLGNDALHVILNVFGLEYVI